MSPYPWRCFRLRRCFWLAVLGTAGCAPNTRPADGPAPATVGTTAGDTTAGDTTPAPASTPPSAVPSDVAGKPGARDPSAKDAGNLRSNSELQRSLNLRRALSDLTRIRLITDYQETAAGALRIVLGEGYPRSQALEYNLEKLRRAYAESTNFDATVDPHLELWRDGRPIGRYTREGLFLDGP